MSLDTHVATALRGAGLRVTAPRMATLDFVSRTPHVDADAIVCAVRDRLGTVSKQAVYDTLNSLTEVGLLRRISPAGRAARYELDSRDGHHHLLCRECGEIEDIRCAADTSPCLNPGPPLSARIDQVDVLYLGRCLACAPASATCTSTTRTKEREAL